MKKTERQTDVCTQGVPYETAIKQLTALSLAKLDENLLAKAVEKVQKTSAAKEQAEKVYEKARIAGADFEYRSSLLAEWQTCVHEYNAACAEFTHTVLGQVFTWLEGAGK